jgi:hypothetical protein
MSLTSSGDIGAPWSAVDERAEEDPDELGVETGREVEIGWPCHGASERGNNVFVQCSPRARGMWTSRTRARSDA